MQMRIKRLAKDVIINILSADKDEGIVIRDEKQREQHTRLYNGGGEICQLLLTAEFTLNDGDEKQINNKLIDCRSFTRR